MDDLPPPQRPRAFEIPTPKPSPRRRTSLIAAAAAVLVLAGTFSIGGAVLVNRAGGSGAIITAVVLAGTAEIVVGILVYRLVPMGRTLGMVFGALGLVFGLIRLSRGTTAAVADVLSMAYVIWALGVSGPEFRGG